MGIFDIFNKKPSVVWRNKSGEIACKGDDCTQKCDNSCPIWCQTMALTLMRMGQAEKAIENLKHAVSIAPDFKSAWVNLAAVYGSLNNHKEANKAYKAAYTLDNKYPNAIYGLIISCKNLGQYNEALIYCNEYEALAGKPEAEQLRQQIKRAQNPSSEKKEQNILDVASQIITRAREVGLLESRKAFPNIPEIVVAGKAACHKILLDLVKQEDGRNPKIWLAWGAYAGIGAVYHWNIDWNNLKNKGIAETLMEPRGSFAMDEYVIDSIGWGFVSEDGKALAHAIYELSAWAFENFLLGKSVEDPEQAAIETMYAMYIFGMVFQMEQLGMR